MIRLRVRRADAKGRVYLSREVSGSELYVAEVEGVFLPSPSGERILSALERLTPRSALGEYLALLEELGEPSPKEAEELARARAWRSAEGSWCTRVSWSRGGARRAVSAGSKASAHCEGWGREPGKSGKI